jgi:hypothetical protein
MEAMKGTPVHLTPEQEIGATSTDDQVQVNISHNWRYGVRA